MSGLLLGVDVGTTATKVGLFTAGGILLAQAHASYALHTETGAEADPEHWWEAFLAGLHHVLASASGQPIAALAIGGQGGALVPVDAAGRALRRALIWMDRRATSEARELSQRLGRRFDAEHLEAKALWLKRHEPAVYQQARYFLQCPDFLTFRLTGAALGTTCSEDTCPWSLDTLEAAGLERFPPLIPIGQPLGQVQAAIAGLPLGTPVISGGLDFFAAILGAASLWPGNLCVTGGTSLCVSLAWHQGLSPPEPRFLAVPFPLLESQQWLWEAFTSTAGKCLEWARDTLAPGLSLAEVLAQAAEAPAGSGGLIFLPYLAGERCPMWDPAARGAFIGLSLGSRRPELLRSVLEGVAYSAAQLVNLLCSHGPQVTQVTATGGLSTAPLWNQILADVLGHPVQVASDATLVGEMLLAGWGTGAFPDLRQAARHAVRLGDPILPNPEHHQRYQEQLGIFQQLYPSLKQVERIR